MCQIDHDPFLPAPWARRLWRTVVVGGLLWAATALAGGPAGAQQSASGATWNGERALDLIEELLTKR